MKENPAPQAVKYEAALAEKWKIALGELAESAKKNPALGNVSREEIARSLYDISRQNIPQPDKAKIPAIELHQKMREGMYKYLIKNEEKIMEKVEGIQTLPPAEKEKLIDDIVKFIDAYQRYEQDLYDGQSAIVVPDSLEKVARNSRRELEFLNLDKDASVVQSLHKEIYPEIDVKEWENLFGEVMRRPPAYSPKQNERDQRPFDEYGAQFRKLMADRRTILDHAATLLFRAANNPEAKEDVSYKNEIIRMQGAIVRYIVARKAYDRLVGYPSDIHLSRIVMRNLALTERETTNMKIVETILPTQYSILRKEKIAQGLGKNEDELKPEDLTSIANKQLLEGSRRRLTLKEIGVPVGSSDPIPQTVIDNFLRLINFDNTSEQRAAAQLLLGYLRKRVVRYSKDMSDLAFAELCGHAHATGASEFMDDLIKQLPNILDGKPPNLRQSLRNIRRSGAEKKEQLKEALENGLKKPLLDRAMLPRKGTWEKRDENPDQDVTKRSAAWEQSMGNLSEYLAGGTAGRISCAMFIADPRLPDGPRRESQEMIDATVTDVCSEDSVKRYLELLLLKEQKGWMHHVGLREPLKKKAEAALRKAFVVDKSPTLREAAELYQMKYTKNNAVIEAMLVVEIIGRNNDDLANDLEAHFFGEFAELATTSTDKLAAKLAEAGISDEQAEELDNLARYSKDKFAGRIRNIWQRAGAWYVNMLDRYPEYTAPITLVGSAVLGTIVSVLLGRIGAQNWMKLNNMSLQDFCNKCGLDFNNEAHKKIALAGQEFSKDMQVKWQAEGRIWWRWQKIIPGANVISIPWMNRPGDFKKDSMKVVEALQKQDWKTFVEKLRQAGCPMETSMQMLADNGVLADQVKKAHKDAGYLEGDIEKAIKKVTFPSPGSLAPEVDVGDTANLNEALRSRIGDGTVINPKALATELRVYGITNLVEAEAALKTAGCPDVAIDKVIASIDEYKANLKTYAVQLYDKGCRSSSGDLASILDKANLSEQDAKVVTEEFRRHERTESRKPATVTPGPTPTLDTIVTEAAKIRADLKLDAKADIKTNFKRK